MELANLYVQLEARGLPQVKRQIDEVRTGLEKTKRTGSGSGGGFIPDDMRKTISLLGEQRRPISMMERSLNKLGGEMGGGLRLATDMFRRSVAEKMQPTLDKLQRSMILQIASTRNWGNMQTWAATQALRIHTAIGRYKEQVAAMEAVLSPATRAARVGFMLLTGSVMGFVAAGLRGTVEGEQLAFQMDMLSKEIAAVFLPIIQDVIQGLRNTVVWFQSLSKKQQDNIRFWVLLAAGALAFVSVLPQVIVATKTAFTVLHAFFTTMLATDPILLGILAIAAAIGLIVEGLREANDEMEDLVYRSTSKEDVEALPFTRQLREMKKEGAGSEEIEAATAKESQRIQTEIDKLNKQADKLDKPWYDQFFGMTKAEKDYSKTFDEIEKLQKELITIRSSADVVSGRQGPSRKGSAAADHMALTRSAGQFESLTASYNRIASASLKMGGGQDPALEHAKNTAESTKKIAEKGVDVNNFPDKPVVGP